MSQGRFVDAGTGGTRKGTLFGETRVPGTSAGTRGRIVAAFELGFDPAGGVTLHTGGEAEDPGLPAVQSTGQCTGPYETFELEFGGEGAAPRAGTATAGAGWGR